MPEDLTMNYFGYILIIGNQFKGRVTNTNKPNNKKYMPRMDKTGPIGDGPMTGYGFGPCGGGTMNGKCNRGRGSWGLFLSPKNRLRALEDEERALMDELEVIKAEKEAVAGRQ